MSTIDWLIATDLDGTLLDDTYPYADAGAVIDEIQQQQPLRVALASSKTLMEMLELAQHARTRPFLIFENGGGVAWPSDALGQSGERHLQGYEITLLGSNVEDIFRCLRHISSRSSFRYRTFSELSDAEIGKLTHLKADAIELARQRLTSEPLLWEDSEQALEDFNTELSAFGFKATRGGRFVHVSNGTSKARALNYLRRKICYERGEKPRVLACGDAPNDLEMIHVADLALLFPSRDGDYLLQPDTKHSHAPKAGPDHWLRGVKQIVTHEVNHDVCQEVNHAVKHI